MLLKKRSREKSGASPLTALSRALAQGESSAEVRTLYPYLKAPTKRERSSGRADLPSSVLRPVPRSKRRCSFQRRFLGFSQTVKMPEETAAASTAESTEEKPCSSSAADSSVDVAEEAKKLIGTGNRHLVMGDVVSAVSVFQEACAMLAEKYGDTADECGEAFFLCGKSLLELARMENTVLGNALEGVPEEEGEKQDDSKIESADNLDEKTRDELREQVYDAMSEEKRDSEDKKEAKEDGKEVKESGDMQAKKEDAEDSAVKKEEKSKSPVKNGENTTVHPAKEEKAAESQGKTAKDSVKTDEKASENGNKTTEHLVKSEKAEDGKVKKSPAKCEEKAVEDSGKMEEGADSSKQEDKAMTNGAKKNVQQDVKSTEEPKDGEDAPEPMEEEGGDDDEEEEEDEDEEEGEGKDDKESEEEEVGNLQLAWEMLEVAKVIYKRKESKDDQLMAAQIFLKLGEVGAESGNYPQALEDFKECLALQLKHLPPHSRLLAETHYQLGTTFSYTAQYNLAIEHFTKSISVIESRLAMLQEVIDKAEGAEEAKEEKNEFEELKQLLPEITEKVEDAKESQKTAAAASEAIHQTLGGASTSSAFPTENGGPSSSSTVSQIAVKPADSASSAAASDISHLVRKKRKPEDESPKKDSDAKKVKQETTVNGSGDSASNSNGVQEKMEQEPVNSTSSVETSA
ncbi:nuclear autoantigenic sperm protein [Astyanax mexicanus]|nr:nuclear autoantigenic sperm protein [Astyanax mexicanus]